MPTPPERTALYRLYSADDVLLYVGISNNPEARWERHKMFRPWWPDVAWNHVEWLPSRDAAFAAEEIAIREEASGARSTRRSCACRSTRTGPRRTCVSCRQP
ncbi:GIY-YIG nuclease family protein [Streptomyces cyaneofuscatus]|uniref:GIY-YIG nuclease family protein n=1 Tax=Streptomyces cyaneofuscatus TaxID=66883 RepID=UPI0036CD1E26